MGGRQVRPAWVDGASDGKLERLQRLRGPPVALVTEFSFPPPLRIFAKILLAVLRRLPRIAEGFQVRQCRGVNQVDGLVRLVCLVSPRRPTCPCASSEKLKEGSGATRLNYP